MNNNHGFVNKINRLGMFLAVVNETLTGHKPR